MPFDPPIDRPPVVVEEPEVAVVVGVPPEVAVVVGPAVAVVVPAPEVLDVVGVPVVLVAGFVLLAPVSPVVDWMGGSEEQAPKTANGNPARRRNERLEFMRASLKRMKHWRMNDVS
jgi:hypothetical protein